MGNIPKKISQAVLWSCGKSNCWGPVMRNIEVTWAKGESWDSGLETHRIQPCFLRYTHSLHAQRNIWKMKRGPQTHFLTTSSIRKCRVKESPHILWVAHNSQRIKQARSEWISKHLHIMIKMSQQRLHVSSLDLSFRLQHNVSDSSLVMIVA